MRNQTDGATRRRATTSARTALRALSTPTTAPSGVAHGAQVLRFGAVGLLGTIVNVAILHLLHNELGWGFTRSSAIATELAIVHNYMWNELWTFHIRRLNIGRLVRYNASSIVAFCVTVGVATIVKEVTDPRLAQLVGILSGAGLNYIVNARWTWGRAAVLDNVPE